MDVFPYNKYPATYGASIEAMERYLSAQFGDGYEQTAKDGINTNLDSYSVSWENYPNTDANEIYVFLRNRLSTTPFKFLISKALLPELGGKEVTVKCTKLNITHPSVSVSTITATLKRDARIGG